MWENLTHCWFLGQARYVWIQGLNSDGASMRGVLSRRFATAQGYRRWCFVRQPFVTLTANQVIMDCLWFRQIETWTRNPLTHSDEGLTLETPSLDPILWPIYLIQCQQILYFIQMALSFYLVVWQSWMLTTVLILKNRKTSYFICLFIYFNPEKQALQLKGILLKRFYWKFRATWYQLGQYFCCYIML